MSGRRRTTASSAPRCTQSFGDSSIESPTPTNDDRQPLSQTDNPTPFVDRRGASARGGGGGFGGGGSFGGAVEMVDEGWSFYKVEIQVAPGSSHHYVFSIPTSPGAPELISRPPRGSRRR